MSNFNDDQNPCDDKKKICTSIIEKLQKANKDVKNGNFPQYIKKIQQIFGLSDTVPVTTELKIFMGGFIKGESSLNVSAKKLQNAKFGLLIDPEFSIAQHVSGIQNLYHALKIFNTGRIRYKSGSNATFVFIIDNRQTLKEKILPFWKTYVIPYGSSSLGNRLKQFEKILSLLESNAHHDKNRFCYELLPVWDSLRKQKGQSNEAFESLEKAQEYIQTFKK